ncbi:MAG TPA: hypothetical protein VHO25_15470 [Polyangiaceae bacterium]|nr:hypothetical protein [Polyangiaceae bacterium]
MKRRFVISMLGVCVAAVTLTACERERPAPKPGQVAAENTQARAKAGDKGTVSDVDLSDIPVPTEEDFEEAAERDITIDNLQSELDRMEKEIGQ